MNRHSHLPHLSRIWISDPIFFITSCTNKRKPILTNDSIARILIDEWTSAFTRHGWMVGRYVIMPDHVHFFCSYTDNLDIGRKNNISSFMQQWKQWTSKRILRETKVLDMVIESPVWEREFFDHLLRSEENYIQKWEYVRLNPVRKNLVEKVEEWQWQGEIYDLS